MNQPGLIRKMKRAQEAQLTFDSVRSKARVGTRAHDGGSRQLLFHCGSFTIDMQLQPKPRSNHILLQGQVLNSQISIEEVGAIPVTLLDEGQVISETITNRFGEFNFTFELRNNLKVFLDMKNGLFVSLPDQQQD